MIARNPQWPESCPKYECRRHAPVETVDGEGNVIGPWPLVQEDDRCGDGMLPGQQTALEKHVQALASYTARKNRQIEIYEAWLRRALRGLELAKVEPL